MGEFAQNVSDLASSDVGKQLAQSLNGLADVERISQDIHSIQAEQDITTLMSTGMLGYSFFRFTLTSLFEVDEYARLINSVRVCNISTICATSLTRKIARIQFTNSSIPRLEKSGK